MPFFLYSLAGKSHEQFTQIRHLTLAGTSGPLAKHAKTQNPQRTDPFPWHASERDLISTEGADPTSNAIVTDLKPSDKERVSLYRLLDVWGFSAKEWTPLALRLQVLFADVPQANPSLFKTSLIDPATDHSLVGEFLYVNGGVVEGNWNWGTLGRVNGALLWKDAFDFLAGALGASLA
jgi:hypothetical protein